MLSIITSLTQALGNQRQGKSARGLESREQRQTGRSLWVQGSLVYRHSHKTARATQRSSASKNKNKKKFMQYILTVLFHPSPPLLSGPHTYTSHSHNFMFFLSEGDILKEVPCWATRKTKRPISNNSEKIIIQKMNMKRNEFILIMLRCLFKHKKEGHERLWKVTACHNFTQSSSLQYCGFVNPLLWSKFVIFCTLKLVFIRI